MFLAETHIARTLLASFSASSLAALEATLSASSLPLKQCIVLNLPSSVFSITPRVMLKKKRSYRHLLPPALPVPYKQHAVRSTQNST